MVLASNSYLPVIRYSSSFYRLNHFYVSCHQINGQVEMHGLLRETWFKFVRSQRNINVAISGQVRVLAFDLNELKTFVPIVLHSFQSFSQKTVIIFSYIQMQTWLSDSKLISQPHGSRFRPSWARVLYYNHKMIEAFSVDSLDRNCRYPTIYIHT